MPTGLHIDGEGICQPPPDGTACDDGDPTTSGDAYSDGVCVGTPISCPQGQVVDENGQCVCQQGLTDCNGDCVDCGSDANNCGACGIVCGEGYVCNNGVNAFTLVSLITLTSQTWNMSSHHLKFGS